MFTVAECQSTNERQVHESTATLFRDWATSENLHQHGLQQRPQVLSQLKLQRSLNQSPQVITQARLAETIAGRKINQSQVSLSNPPVQRTLDVNVPSKGRTEYWRKSAIEKNVPPSAGNRVLLVNLLYYWAQLDEKKAFDSWPEAIEQATEAIVDIMDQPHQEEVFELLQAQDFNKTHIQKLKQFLQITPLALSSEDLSPTAVTPIDVSQKELIDVIDIEGNLVGQEEMVHPIFQQITGGQSSFIIVKLPEVVDENTLSTPLHYNDKTYRIDLMAGSAIKPAKGKPGSVYGIEQDRVEMFKNMFGYEESAYYAQRSLFPLVNAGVTGKIRGRAYPQEKGMEHSFRLKDGTLVEVNDGWGYIKQSLAHQMQQGGMQYEKRQPQAQSGKASHQMMEWLDEETPEVIQELVQWGLDQWYQGYQEFLQQQHNPESHEYFQSKRSLMSLLTTGKPPLEMAVAMPVPGQNVVVPHRQPRYSKHLPGEMSLIRSPVDKQNFRPVSSENIEQHTKISRLVGNIEGIQYTLTGRQDDSLTFFKGMVGVIDDRLWPDAWKGTDLVVSSKDRKLFEKWVRDTSLEEAVEEEVDPETDRSQMSKAIQNFTIDGTLAAIQWFAKGSFIGVPEHIQKWLGGDYDGDEVAALFGATNPQLQTYIRDQAYQELEVNPKLQKTFTFNPGSSRAKRMVAMRSANVGNWSNIAAQVRSLPMGLKQWLAEQTANERLLPDEEELNNLEESQRMEKEIQLGIKVGTDAYKTSANVEQFEARAKMYLHLLKTSAKPIMHNKKLLDVFDTAGVWPTLQAPAWRNMFFSYDEVNQNTGEYIIKGISARVLQKMLWGLMNSDELQNINHYYGLWKKEEGFDPTGTRGPQSAYVITALDQHNQDVPGATQQILSRINFFAVRDFQMFQKAFVAEGRKYWKQFNPATYQLAQKRDGNWLSGLIPLLKRYYFAI